MIPELTDLDIKDGDVVAVDLETHDPDLKTHGSGAIVGKGNAMKKQYQHDSELWNKHNGTDVGNTVLSDLGLSKKPEGLSWSNFFRSGGNL